MQRVPAALRGEKPQWTVLRRWVRRSGWWLPANMLAWALGMPVVFVGAGAVPPGATGLGVAGPILLALVVAGAVVGAVHGAVLARLLGVTLSAAKGLS